MNGVVSLEKIHMNRVDSSVTDEEIRSYFSPFHVYSVRRMGERVEVEVRDAETALFEKSNTFLLGKRTFLSLPVSSSVVDMSRARRPVPAYAPKKPNTNRRRRNSDRGGSGFDDVF